MFYVVFAFVIIGFIINLVAIGGQIFAGLKNISSHSNLDHLHDMAHQQAVRDQQMAHEQAVRDHQMAHDIAVNNFSDTCIQNSINDFNNSCMMDTMNMGGFGGFGMM